jgi:Tfp pilus assembly protein PilF
LLDTVLAVDPANSAAAAERGRLAWRAGQYEQAEHWLREALLHDFSNVGARYQLVQCLLQLGRVEESREEERRLKQTERDLVRIREIVSNQLQLHPRDPALHCEVGVIALRAGFPQEGLRWLRSALQINPDYPLAHRAMAGYYELTGNLALAARHRELARKASAASSPAALPTP